jgi:Ice-binding-like
MRLKLKQFNRKPHMISSRKNWLSLAIAVSFFLGAFNASANLLQALPTMGDLLRWGVFSLGDFTIDDTAAKTSGRTYVMGDVGVAGTGNITMSGKSAIDGNLYYRSNGTLKMTGGAKVNGMIFHNMDAVLDNGVNEAINSSNLAASYASSTFYASLNNITLTDHQNLTIFAQGDRPGNSTVLNLQNFSLTGGSTLTLQGTASSQFIINVTKQFSLTSSSRIVLNGGVQWDDVLFNVRGGGSNVTIDGTSLLQGVLMANNRTVRISGGSAVYGEVIGGKVQLTGGSVVIRPPISSP